MNEHQNIAQFVYNFLSSDYVNIPGSRGNDVQNAKGWLASIVQGTLEIKEAPAGIPEGNTGGAPVSCELTPTDD